MKDLGVMMNKELTVVELYHLKDDDLCYLIKEYIRNELNETSHFSTHVHELVRRFETKNSLKGD